LRIIKRKCKGEVEKMERKECTEKKRENNGKVAGNVKN
jgi:hypothetical protein